MPLIPTKVFVPGDVTNVPEANLPHSSLATASSDVDQTNTRIEWATRRHFTRSDKEAHPITPYVGQVEDAANVANYNNTAWATISNGGAAMQTPAALLTLTAGDILRLHAGSYVGEVNDGDHTEDIYWFRFVANMSINGAAYADVQLGPDFGYSITSRREVAGAGFHQVFGQQRVGHSWIHVCTNASEIISINGLRYQVKLENAANDIDLGPAHFITIQSKH